MAGQTTGTTGPQAVAPTQLIAAGASGPRVSLCLPPRNEFGEQIVDIIGPSGVVIGLVSFRNVDRRRAQAELGIDLLEPYRGQGYGPEAIRLLLRELFDNHGMQRVYLRVREWNKRARRAYDKVGFRYVRTVRWPLIGVVRYLVMDIRADEFTWRPGPG